MTITGQLGDVMKESAAIAVTLVKELYPEKAELFAKNDLHGCMNTGIWRSFTAV